LRRSSVAASVNEPEKGAALSRSNKFVLVVACFAAALALASFGFAATVDGNGVIQACSDKGSGALPAAVALDSSRQEPMADALESNAFSRESWGRRYRPVG
jgi:hypothetical protein